MKIEVNTHEKNMIRFAAEHPEVVVMSADLGSSCEVKKFRQVYPDRYLTMGIAEQNMCSWAAGMAREGYRPFLHTFAVFLYRRILDQLEMSVAYPNLPVVFVGFVPGITTPGGVTHQSINDIGVLRTVPNMTIFDIGDATEIEGVLDLAYERNGPVFIRMLRKEVPRLFPANEPMQFNCARVLSEGDDIVLLSSSICTEEAMRATAVLKEKGVSVQHMHVSTLKPFTDPIDIRIGDPQEQIRRYHHREPSGYRRSRHGSGRGDRGERSGQASGEDRPAGLSAWRIQDVSDEEVRYRRNAPVGAVEELTGKSLGIQEDDLEKVRFVDFLEV